MRETQPRILLQRKAARLGLPQLQSHAPRALAPHRLLTRALVRPTMVLIRSPIVLVMSLYTALVFGVMYLLFTTFTDLFESQYRFSRSLSGLAYLGLAVALVAAMATSSAIGGRVGTGHDGASVGARRPETRLILMIWFSPLVGLGLFVYGWTAHYGAHWIVPITGTALIGFGAFFVLVSPLGSRA